MSMIEVNFVQLLDVTATIFRGDTIKTCFPNKEGTRGVIGVHEGPYLFMFGAITLMLIQPSGHFGYGLYQEGESKG